MIPAKKDTQNIIDGIEKKIQNDENLAHLCQVIDVLFGKDEKRITKLLDEMFDQVQQNKSVLRHITLTLAPRKLTVPLSNRIEQNTVYTSHGVDWHYGKSIARSA